MMQAVVQGWVEKYDVLVYQCGIKATNCSRDLGNVRILVWYKPPNPSWGA